MKRASIIFLVFGLALLSTLPTVVDAAPFDYDVSVTAQSPAITFSPSSFYAGDNVRIYGLLSNVGNRDVSGLVAFFQGPAMIGTTTAFSSRANGAPEEVWVDWIPTAGTYNISFRILSATPTDQDITNNQALTSVMTITVAPPPPPPPVTPPPSSGGSSGPTSGSGSGSSGSGTGSTTTSSPTPLPSSSTSGNTRTSGTITAPTKTPTSTNANPDNTNQDQPTENTLGSPYESTTATVEDIATPDTGNNTESETVKTPDNVLKKSSNIPLIMTSSGILALLLLITAYFVYKKSKNGEGDGFELD